MKRIIPLISIIAFMLMIIIKPDYYILSATKGLALFATSVLPALFPFFFCTTLLTRMGMVQDVSRCFQRPARFLFGAPKEGAYAAFCSFLCGYPVGAAVLTDLYKGGLICRDDVKKCISFCSTSGPIFIIGTVGTVIMHDYKAGIVILICHYLSAVTNGVLFGRVFNRANRRSKDSYEEKPNTLNQTLDNSDGILSEAVSASTLSMLALGGFIVLGNMLIDTLSLILPNNTPLWFQAIAFGGIEMTRGCMEASSLLYPYSIAAASAILSFGGLSVIMQSISLLSRCGIRARDLLLCKLCQAVIAFMYSLIVCFFTN